MKLNNGGTVRRRILKNISFIVILIKEVCTHECWNGFCECVSVHVGIGESEFDLCMCLHTCVTSMCARV